MVRTGRRGAVYRRIDQISLGACPLRPSSGTTTRDPLQFALQFKPKRALGRLLRSGFKLPILGFGHPENGLASAQTATRRGEGATLAWRKVNPPSPIPGALESGTPAVEATRQGPPRPKKDPGRHERRGGKVVRQGPAPSPAILKRLPRLGRPLPPGWTLLTGKPIAPPPRQCTIFDQHPRSSI